MADLIPIGGNVGYEPLPEGVTPDSIIDPESNPTTHKTTRAEIKLYNREADLIHEIRIEAPTVELARYRPQTRDRATINGFMLVRVLMEQNVDARALREILIQAQFGINQIPEVDRSERTSALYEKIDKILDEIGGEK